MTKLLDTHEVAALLGLRSQTLDLWRTVGKGPQWVKLGKRNVRYRQADVDAYIQSLTSTPTTPPPPAPPLQPTITFASLERLPKRVRTTLADEGLTIEQVATMTDAQLRALPGVGQVALKALREVWPTPQAPHDHTSSPTPQRLLELEAALEENQEEIARLKEDKHKQKRRLERLEEQAKAVVRLLGTFEDEDGDEVQLMFEPEDLVGEDMNDCGVSDEDGNWSELKKLDAIEFQNLRWEL